MTISKTGVKALDIKKQLVRAGDGFAIEMVEAMEKYAAASPSYADLLDTWLKRGGTIRLRRLCDPFREWSFLKTLGPHYPVPWFNCVDAIDSAWLGVSQS